MKPEEVHQADPTELADPNWFRQPTRREHWMGAALFAAFGIWFVLLFVVLGGWWFRWIILAMGLLSLVRGARHLIGAIGLNEHS